MKASRKVRRKGIKSFTPCLFSLVSLISILAPLSPKICARWHKSLNTHGQPCLTDCVLGLQALEGDLTKCISRTRALELPAPPWLVELMKLCVCVCVCVCVCLVAQWCPTLCDPVDCSLPGSSSVHEDSPSKNTGVGCHALLQGIFLTQGLRHCRQILYHLSHQGSPRMLEWVAYPFPSFLPDPGIEPGSAGRL